VSSGGSSTTTTGLGHTSSTAATMAAMSAGSGTRRD
jgi:hypothetical protein